jgi:hypothetical protein
MQGRASRRHYPTGRCSSIVASGRDACGQHEGAAELGQQFLLQMRIATPGAVQDWSEYRNIPNDCNKRPSIKSMGQFALRRIVQRRESVVT